MSADSKLCIDNSASEISSSPDPEFWKSNPESSLAPRSRQTLPRDEESSLKVNANIPGRLINPIEKTLFTDCLRKHLIIIWDNIKSNAFWKFIQMIQGISKLNYQVITFANQEELQESLALARVCVPYSVALWESYSQYPESFTHFVFERDNAKRITTVTAHLYQGISEKSLSELLDHCQKLTGIRAWPVSDETTIPEHYLRMGPVLPQLDADMFQKYKERLETYVKYVLGAGFVLKQDNDDNDFFDPTQDFACEGSVKKAPVDAELLSYYAFLPSGSYLQDTDGRWMFEARRPAIDATNYPAGVKNSVPKILWSDKELLGDYERRVMESVDIHNRWKEWENSDPWGVKENMAKNMDRAVDRCSLKSELESTVENAHVVAGEKAL